MGPLRIGQAGFLGTSLLRVESLAASFSSCLPSLADRKVRMGWDEGIESLNLADFLPLLIFSEGAGVAGLDPWVVLLLLAFFWEEEDGGGMEGCGSAGMKDGLGRSQWVILSSNILLFAFDLLLSPRHGLALKSA